MVTKSGNLMLREKAVRDSGYGKIHERGCYDVHPELDAFDAETNRMLIDLWKTAEPTKKQFKAGE